MGLGLRKNFFRGTGCLLLLAALLCACGDRDTAPETETGQKTVSPADEEESENAVGQKTAGGAGKEDTGSADGRKTTPDENGKKEETKPVEKEPEYPSDFTDKAAVTRFLNQWNCMDYVPRAPLSSPKEDGGDCLLGLTGGYPQGACTDGTYLYQAVPSKVKKVGERQADILYKIDLSTWEVVAESDWLGLDHANDLTYNSKTGQLVVAHHSGSTGAAKLISFVDPETLTLIETRELGMGLGNIAYNETRDQYVIRISKGYDFAVLDSEFQLVQYFPGVSLGLGGQNLDCDDRYIYFGDTGVKSDPGTEAVKVFDWEGNLKGIFRIAQEIRNDKATCEEQESLFHVGNDYYVTLGPGGGKVYRITYDWSLLGDSEEASEAEGAAQTAAAGTKAAAQAAAAGTKAAAQTGGESGGSETENAPGNAEQYHLENVEPLENSPLEGKRILFLGSSVTKGSRSLDVSMADYIGKRNKCEVVKEAVSGTTLSTLYGNSYVERLNNVDTGRKFDMVVCQLSTNDASAKRAVALGEIIDSENPEDFNTKTVAGAIEYIVAYCRETWDCPVVIYTGTRYSNVKYQKMVELLPDIQEKWGIGVVDLWNNEEMNAVSEEDYALYMYDSIHPTQAGYLWWTPVIEEELNFQILN